MTAANEKSEKPKLDVRGLVQQHEQWFEHGNRRIPYMFFPCTGTPTKKKLLISFGAWGGGYNRVRGYYEDLRPTHDLLYLQDNHGPEKKGPWYLAENLDFSLEEAYTALIDATLKKTGVAKSDVWLLGSSMGGFAALYYAYKFDMGRVVAICPLMAIKALYEGKSNLFSYIMGDSQMDVDEYIFRTFDKTVSTEVHMFFCKDDDKLINARMGHLLNLFIKNRNKFTVQSYDIIRPEGVSAHSVGVSIMGRDGIIGLFNKDLIVKHIPDMD